MHQSINIAIVGNPNVGKSSLINAIAGSDLNVGNYAGVTVSEHKIVFSYNNKRFNLIDLPGVYSLNPYTQEESITTDYLLNNRPDIIVQVVDTTNLERNLYFTIQLLDLNIPLVIALNMADEAATKNIYINHKILQQEYNITAVNTVATKKIGIKKLLHAIYNLSQNPAKLTPHLTGLLQIDEVQGKCKTKIRSVYRIHENLSEHLTPQSAICNSPLTYAPPLQNALKQIQLLLKQHDLYSEFKAYPPNWLAFKLLDTHPNAYDNQQLLQHIKLLHEDKKLQQIMHNLNEQYTTDISSVIATARYEQAAHINLRITHSSNTSTKNNSTENTPIATNTDNNTDNTAKPKPDNTSDLSTKIDKILLHNYLGIPIFILIMWLVFKLTFDLATPFVDWTNFIFSNYLTKWNLHLLELIHAPSWLISLTNDGIIAGVGFVLTFVPIIFSMMFFLTLLETTGYMARVAFIMDKSMQKIGLHGKSFISMLVGFGCNVPAVYATRTLNSSRDRIITAMIIPFMSCSARIPVYILFTAAFFPQHASKILLILYLLGIAIAMLVGVILNKILAHKEESFFIMELPPYRLPTIKNLILYTNKKTKSFLKKAGTYIFVVSILVWVLLHMPLGVVEKKQSYLGQLGSILAPVLQPLGFGNWQAASSLITGVIAKEVVVSTMGEIYATDITPPLNAEINFIQDIQEIGTSFLNAALSSINNLVSSVSLASVSFTATDQSISLKTIIHSKFTALSALSFMVFTLLYMPCIVTGIAMKNELGTWKWFCLSALLSLILAWCCSFLIYQIGGLI